MRIGRKTKRNQPACGVVDRGVLGLEQAPSVNHRFADFKTNFDTMTEDYITSIQVYESTRQKLEEKKIIDAESFNDCVLRLIEESDE